MFSPMISMFLFAITGALLVKSKVYLSGSFVLLGSIPNFLMQVKLRFFPTEYIVPADNIDEALANITPGLDHMNFWALPLGVLIIAIGFIILLANAAPNNKHKQQDC
jgi:hypothetical protein